MKRTKQNLSIAGVDRTALLLILLMCGFAFKASANDSESPSSDFDSVVLPFLKTHCVDCHGESRSKGGLQLHDIGSDFGEPDTLNQWQLVLEQLSLGDMPPPKQSRPDPKQVLAVTQWIEGELGSAGQASDLSEKLKSPAYGNYVDHDKLFSGEITVMPFSPSRLWKRSPAAFDYSKHFVFGTPGYSMFHFPRTTFSGNETKREDPLPAVKQAFAIEDRHGFKDYAALLHADSSTLDTLMRNAEFIADRCLEGVMKEIELQQEGATLQEWRKQMAEQQRVFNGRLRALASRRDAARERDPKGREAEDLQHEHDALKNSWKRPSVKDTAEEYRAVALSQGPLSTNLINGAVSKHFKNILQRDPTEKELAKYAKLLRSSRREAGNVEALRLVLMAVVLSPEAVYRMELGLGRRDVHGRRMLSPVELAFAISLALTDAGPDDALIEAAREGRLNSKEDVRREVVRLLENDGTQKPRILRFFHEYFGYHKAPGVFKDNLRYDGREHTYGLLKYPQKIVEDTDVLIRHIVAEDKEVLKELLTTDKYFVQHKGNNEHSREEAEAIEQFCRHFKDLEWRKFNVKIDPRHREFTRSITKPYFFNDFFFSTLTGKSAKYLMAYFEKCKASGIRPSHLFAFDERSLGSLFAYNLDPKTWDYPVEQPFKLPGRRVGILSHPSWLIAHSLNLHNDPIRRGKWIQERLLGGTVPDVPITVDASIPEDPHKTLRERLSVTEGEECWKCHVKMNPLGYPFESFNDFGMLRESEPLEQLEKVDGKLQVKALNTRGALYGTGDSALDGEVEDHVDLMQRLAKSERVRQVFIRHAFRYWMGRNEVLSDSKDLIAADRAYVEGGGSFKALVTSLLTSDSFMYRKALD